MTDINDDERCMSRYEGWRCELARSHVQNHEKHRVGDGGQIKGAEWWQRGLSFEFPEGHNDAPVLGEGKRGKPYPQEGSRMGPAWQAMWNRLQDNGDTFTSGAILAKEVAAEYGMTGPSLQNLIRVAANVGYLDVSETLVMARHHATYRVARRFRR